jgi:hypothetical protein
MYIYVCMCVSLCHHSPINNCVGLYIKYDVYSKCTQHIEIAKSKFGRSLVEVWSKFGRSLVFYMLKHMYYEIKTST